MPSTLLQLDAELSHVLVAVIHELDGIAHDYMACTEMHQVIDNMIAKGGVPKTPSVHLTRWMHLFSKNPDFKIAQIREALMSKDLVAVVPDCLGLFFDAAAPECRMCADAKVCRKRQGVNSNMNKAETTEARVKTVYPAGKANLDPAVIHESLESKLGQIAKILARGSRVVLVSDSNKSLRVLTTPSTTTQQEPIMAKDTKIDTKGKKAIVEDDDEDEESTPVSKTVKKGAPAPAKVVKKAAKPVIEDDDEDDEVEEVEEGEEEEEEEAPKAKKATKKAAKPVIDEDDEDADEDGDEEEEEEEEAPKAKKGKFKPVEKKAKKEKKPAPELNKAQAEFKEALKTTYKDDKKLLKFAKELGVTWNPKEDARINRMLCVMAVQKHLGTIGGKAKKK